LSFIVGLAEESLVADGTPLLVVSHGTLHTPQFDVSFVSHVPQLHW
jgi:hypothetical protein